jgi:hypothetical protein
VSRFGQVLLDHALVNDANFTCTCGVFPSPQTEVEYVAHFEAALAEAGLKVVEVS